MSRTLSKLLGAEEPHFSLMIKELEYICGGPSSDVRLAAKIMAEARQKLDRLGLDPADTNGPELYYSLLKKAKEDDEFLSQKFSVGQAAESYSVSAIQAMLKNNSAVNGCWAVKAGSLRRLLKTRPPKNVMSRLGYRSLDSMLKRENIFELYAASHLVETPNWQQRFAGLVETLKNSDYENRSVSMLQLDSSKWGTAASEFVARHKRHLLCLDEVGTVVILPPPGAPPPGAYLATLSLAVYFVNRIRQYSVYRKLRQIRLGFEDILNMSSQKKDNTSARLRGLDLPWPVLQRHFSSTADIFEPHLTARDLNWVAVGDVLAPLAPALNFWQGNGYAGGIYDDGVVSLNVLDVSLNYCNNISYHKRLVYYMRQSLWHELLGGYVSHAALQPLAISQLKNRLAISKSSGNKLKTVKV